MVQTCCSFAVSGTLDAAIRRVNSRPANSPNSLELNLQTFVAPGELLYLVSRLQGSIKGKEGGKKRTEEKELSGCPGSHKGNRKTLGNLSK